MAICPGCVGRGTGTRCFVCGGDIPADRQRGTESRSEWSADCSDCVAGRRHTH
jgi:hypothetical protein